MKFQGVLKSEYNNNISADSFQEMAVKQCALQLSAITMSKTPKQ